jgi:hypothetical protein
VVNRVGGHLAGPRYAAARATTIRTRVINVAARLAHHARGIHLHMPEHWPWQAAWSSLFAAVTAAPDRTSTSDSTRAAGAGHTTPPARDAPLEQADRVIGDPTPPATPTTTDATDSTTAVNQTRGSRLSKVIACNELALGPEPCERHDPGRRIGVKPRTSGDRRGSGRATRVQPVHRICTDRVVPWYDCTQKWVQTAERSSR